MFAVLLYFSRRSVLPLQSYWSLSCDHGLDFWWGVNVRTTTTIITSFFGGESDPGFFTDQRFTPYAVYIVYVCTDLTLV